MSSNTAMRLLMQGPSALVCAAYAACAGTGLTELPAGAGHGRAAGSAAGHGGRLARFFDKHLLP